MVWRAPMVSAYNKLQLLSMLSFSLLIILLSRGCVGFVCLICLHPCISWYVHLPLPSLRVFPAPLGFDGVVSRSAHPLWLQGWATCDGLVRDLPGIPRLETEFFFYFWIKSSKSVIPELSRVTFMWWTCKEDRGTLKPIHMQLSKRKMFWIHLDPYPSGYRDH